MRGSRGSSGIRTVWLALALGAIGTPGLASAQCVECSMQMFNTTLSNNVTQGLDDSRNLDREQHDREYIGRTPAQSRHTVPQVRSRSAALSLTYDPGVSERSKRLFLDGIEQRKGARVAAQIKQSFDEKDVRTAFAEIVRPYGLRPDDYGDVFAAYLTMMWMIANQAPDPTLDQVQAVSGQVHGMFARSGVEGTRDQLQSQAEGMMYEIVSSVYARQGADRDGNAEVLKKMAALAQQNFQGKGLDLQAMALAPSGLKRR